jgi:RNA polymerase sigma-70 factor, ECF subfamily
MSATLMRSRVTTDSALLAGIAAGDERALGALYDRYGATVYSLAYAMTGDETTAETVVSDVFAQVWREPRSGPATRVGALSWITSLARVRAKSLRRAESGSVALGVTAPVNGDRDGSRSTVRAAIADLPEDQRRVLELAYLGGMTVGEVARQLNLQEAAARAQLNSAMHFLRAALGSRVATPDRLVATRV